ncbi:Uma2 family endonuclease [Nonomuraea turkmeniaca]|uniref:Uma2 family endonuclease n=1 Tax=Nonomuraea turkmeniaca TaxID=103838 RepID=A0A5S4FED8_9ACTN|nr:Uma2 family endonuclease [Nonomuraea turkmeniaca]TMR05501.1 Uma2 family endonuclease [Nonomuraea turkmeniaca]
MGEGETPDTEWVTAMATIEPTGLTAFPAAPFTVDDLFKFPDDENRYELFNGSLVVSPAPTPRHQRVITRLAVILQAAAPPELECLTTVNVSPSNEDLYIPDLVVVPEEVSEAVDLIYAPSDLLLAVEVVSPSSKSHDRATKVAAYADAGIPLYWRIEPMEGPTVYIYELDGRTYAGPTVHKAGTMVTLSSPFPVSFDPADLLRLRGWNP